MGSEKNAVFDLTKYDTEGSNGFPYFKLKQTGAEFFIYQGNVRTGTYLYYKITGNSNAAELCKSYLAFIEKNNNAERTDDLIDSFRSKYDRLMHACEDDAEDKIFGLEAWLKYWDDCGEINKAVHHFGVIYHLQALKEWYSLKLNEYILHLESNIHRSLTSIEKITEVEKFSLSTAEEIKCYLLEGTNGQQKSFKDITILQAAELIQFYEWILNNASNEIPKTLGNTNKLTIRNDSINNLEEAVKNDEALKTIIEILNNAGLIDPDTHYFIDKKGGAKGAFYSGMISFFERGYFRKKPSTKEYLNICNNTFNADIKIGTAKNHNTRAKSGLTVPPFTLSD